MSDADIESLRREAASGDELAVYRWRLALVRAGRGDEAGLREGDEVEVEEHQSPWIIGPWRGVVMPVPERGARKRCGCSSCVDAPSPRYVRPIDSVQRWRVNASSECISHGLFLSQGDPPDRVTLLSPVSPERTPR